MKNHIGIAGMLVKNIITAQQKTEKRSKPESPGRDLRYNIKRTNIQITGIAEEEKQKVAEKNLKR